MPSFTKVEKYIYKLGDSDRLYARVRIPADVRYAFPKKECIQRALYTSDIDEARTRLARMLVEMHGLFEQKRVERPTRTRPQRETIASMPR